MIMMEIRWRIMWIMRNLTENGRVKQNKIGIKQRKKMEK